MRAGRWTVDRCCLSEPEAPSSGSSSSLIVDSSGRSHASSDSDVCVVLPLSKDELFSVSESSAVTPVGSESEGGMSLLSFSGGWVFRPSTRVVFVFPFVGDGATPLTFCVPRLSVVREGSLSSELSVDEGVADSGSCILLELSSSSVELESSDALREFETALVLEVITPPRFEVCCLRLATELVDAVEEEEVPAVKVDSSSMLGSTPRAAVAVVRVVEASTRGRASTSFVRRLRLGRR